MTAVTGRGRPRVGGFVWHVHHDTLCQPPAGPFAKRVAFIMANKPAKEIATRLRWMTPVRGKVPAALNKAQAAYDKAWAAYNEAWAAYGPALARLHAKEHPGCPWDGTRLVFP